MPNRAVREPAPPSWHAVLLANVHVLVHHIGGGEGGGGEGGGGEGDGGVEGGGEGGSEGVEGGEGDGEGGGEGGAGQDETVPETSVKVVGQEQTVASDDTAALDPWVGSRDARFQRRTEKQGIPLGRWEVSRCGWHVQIPDR